MEERILNKIKPNQYVIVLDIQGYNWGSDRLANEIEKLSIHGRSQILFVIGESNGLSDLVLKRANHKLLFSKMTFPHQLMKLILLEQTYRAFKIQQNEPYHR